MVHSPKRFMVVIFLLFLTACGGGSDSTSSANSIAQYVQFIQGLSSDGYVVA
jgi:hypothetical protein